MFHKLLAIKCLTAVLAALYILAVPSGAAAQQLRINTGCPTLGSADIGNYTIEQLNQLCHNNGGTATDNTPPRPAEDGAILTCGQHRALAAAGRINIGYVEGQASQQVVDEHCQGLPDDAIPSGSQIGGDQLSGSYRFERGYFTRWTGSKARTCQTFYSGTAWLDQGVITFTSGGHTWTGTISQNSFISITRDGVVPRPKNYTVISGPILDAQLYNGFCGEGFFRLIL